MANNHIPIQTNHLFPVLDKMLIELLESLTEAEWDSPTIAKQWQVKDIAAHLLDGNIRGLSILRDGYFGEKPGVIDSYSDLVQWLNQLNADFVQAARRMSPQVLMHLLAITGQQFCEQLIQLPPFEPAVFSVAWAGQEVSPNWFHIAREYTEKFLHQQQIRHAVGKPSLLTPELFPPFAATFMQGLPHTYRDVAVPDGTSVTIIVNTNAGGKWSMVRNNQHWEMVNAPIDTATSTVTLSPDTAWQLFSKGITPAQARAAVQINGDEVLGEVALNLVAVMA